MEAGPVRRQQSQKRLAELDGRLRDAQQDAARRRHRIQVPCVSVGCVFLLCGMALMVAHGPLPTHLEPFASISTTVAWGCMLLALLPSQPNPIVVVNAIMIPSCLVPIPQYGWRAAMCFLGPSLCDVPDAAGQKPPLWFAYFRAVGRVTLVMWFLLASVHFSWLLWISPLGRLHLERLWLGVGRTCLYPAFYWFVEGAFMMATWFSAPQNYTPLLAESLTFFLLSVFARQPCLRLGMQTLLAERGQVTAAMAVGQLVASRPLEEVLPKARGSFRCVSLDRVTQAMMAENTPNPRLRAHTEPATLGAVDAFLSHSWSDDADAKWEALQNWREHFKSIMGREPRVWIDKFCIDQDNIHDSLAGLPIYLAGCDKLLVLLGETYQTRLWCLLEIFTFIVIGGDRESIEIQPLGAREADFDHFDARSATCAKPEDRDHLLGVIETGIGSIDKFNSTVLQMVHVRTSTCSCSLGHSATEPLPSLIGGPPRRGHALKVGHAITSAVDAAVASDDDEAFAGSGALADLEVGAPGSGDVAASELDEAVASEDEDCFAL